MKKVTISLNPELPRAYQLDVVAQLFKTDDSHPDNVTCWVASDKSVYVWKGRSRDAFLGKTYLQSYRIKMLGDNK